MTLNNLLQGIPLLEVIGDMNINISSIQFDSRKIQTGNVFVAIRGTSVDGHQFIPSAIEKGAVAIVCEEYPVKLNPNVTYVKVENSAEVLGKIACAWFGFPSSKLILVGVTGTNGKTTVATLLYQTFRKLGCKAGLLSTVRNYIDEIPMEVTHTTPDPLELNEYLAKMVEAGCQYAFMEVSSHAIDQRRIAGLEFKGGIFTNLTRDHIDYHLTFENYLKAKKRFFDDLPSTAFALTNLDDKNGLVMVQNTKAPIHTYSLYHLADFKTKIIEQSWEGMLLEMNGKQVHVNFVGRFNASNLTAIYGGAVLLGAEEMEVLRIISTLHPVSGRFETLHSPTGFTVIVDYAHTPDALKNVIETIHDILQGKGRLITVVGCGGNRDKGKRPLMAQEVVKGSWKAILTSDNPRFEDPMEILNDMLAGLTSEEKSQCLTIVDRKEAIKMACALAQPGDVVLIAGKGHEDYQIVQGKKQHFDDKEEVEKYFKIA